MTERGERTGFMASACRRCLAGALASVGAGRAALHRALVLAVLLAFAVNLVIWLVASGFLGDQEGRNALLKERIGELDQQSLRIRDVKEKTSELVSHAEIVAQLLAASDRAVRDLQTVAELIRDLNAAERSATSEVAASVRLDDLEITRKGLSLRGEANRPAGVSELLRRLQTAGYQDVRLSHLALVDMPQPGWQAQRSFVIGTGPRADDPVQTGPANASAAASVALPPPPAAPDEDDSNATFILIGAGGVLVGVTAVLLWFLRKRLLKLVAALRCLRAWLFFSPADRLAGRRRCAAVDNVLQRLRSIDPANPDGWPPHLRLLVVVEVFLLSALIAFSLGGGDTLDELETARREEYALRDAYRTKYSAFGAGMEKAHVERFAAAERDFGADAARIPAVPDDVGLLAGLERIAGANKVSLSRLQKEGTERLHASHATQAWSLHVSGSFSALGSMLEDIGRIGPLVSLAGLRLRPLADAQRGLLLEGVLETHRRLSDAEVATLKAQKKGKK